MAVVQLSNAFFSCLAADTKPITATTGSFLVETDTYKTFVYNGSAWTQSNQALTDVTKVTANSPYTVLATDSVIRADAVGGEVTVTLPTAVGITGKTYTIKRVDILASSVLVTIATTSSQTIDGAANHYLWPAEFVVLESDGANWQVVNRTAVVEYSTMLKGTTPNRRYIAGCQTIHGSAIQGTTSPAINTLWAMPFYVTKPSKFDIISFNITTGAASSQARAGIYLDSGNMYPGKLYFDTGAISTVAAGVKDTTITAGLQVFSPGLYWLAWECDTTGLQVMSHGTANTIDAFLGRPATLTATVNSYGYSVAHTFGALPDPYTTGGALLASSPSATNPVILVGLRPI